MSTLSNWFSGTFPGKKIVFWGDSTTSNATGMFGAAAQPVVASPGRIVTVYQQIGQWLVGTQVLNYGNNGSSLAASLADQGTYGITALLASAPDLIVMCWGINDVRLGLTTQPQLVALLTQAVNAIRAALPRCDIVLWGPNAFQSDDNGSTGFVSPLASAQTYTDILYNAYAALVGTWPNVIVVQKQDTLGQTCVPHATATWMTDILHPNTTGQKLTLDALIPAIAPARYVIRNASSTIVNAVVWDGVDTYPLPNGWTATLDPTTPL
jgi:lysophospholipase L1-like esterase